MDKSEIIKRTRKIAADSLLETLKEILQSDKQISEVEFRDKWLENLRKNSEIFPDGWYLPSPNGISVLFATENDPSRTNFKTLRIESNWPKDDIFLNKQTGLIFVYCSPVDKNSGLIGDFGMSIYFGKNPKIQNLLKQTLEIDRKIFDHIERGMSLSQIAQISNDLLKEKNLSSDLISSSDPTGTNIGHSIPFSYEDMNEEEKRILENAETDWESLKNLLSRKRHFLNSQDNLRIKNGIALTIEPRPESLENPDLPMVSFHTIALFKENGEKELLTGFNEIFKLTEINYLLDLF